MKIIVCLDDSQGMCFNKRRVSRDRVVTEKILELSKDGLLWIHPFSAKLFENVDVQIDEAFLEKAGHGDFCFVEHEKLESVIDRIEEIVVFWWNRSYPSDLKFDLNLANFKKTSVEEFSGYSHEKITKEVYVK